ncbi:unnamed protein product [Malus baccata var. baccata]
MEGSDIKPVCKQKPRRKKENQEIENEGDENNYFRWNVDMERALADILHEERRLGNKGDGGWKIAAYNSAASILSAQFDIHFWKKFYAIVSDILSESGFSWDATKKMISVDEDHVWQEYVRSHSGAKSFRWKVIPNWDNVLDLCGKDRATSEGAETGVEAVEIMTPPYNEIINDISPTSANDMIADSLAKMAISFQDYICSDTKKLDPIEVYDEVNAIPNLIEEEQIKACAWLIENDKQFLMLKTLPVEKKKNMVLLFTS